MNDIKTLLLKSTQTLCDEGIATFLSKTKNYISTNLLNNKSSEEPKKYYMDVLFINGCSLPHPARYRVTHQREQLLASNITSNEVYYTDLTLDLVRNYRVFIFYRCPFTEMIGKFIHLAKTLHKTIIFDIDDLVIDTKYTNMISYVQNMPINDKKVYENGVNLIGKTLQKCDIAITTTERLATELSKYVKRVYINRNVASEQMIKYSEKAFNNKTLSKADKQKEIILGYFSGSITHNDDFEFLIDVLVELFEKYSFLKLKVVGELDLPTQLKKYKDRIIASPFVDWTKLPELIASVDINLSPLVNNIFNEAKSENKWVEAALVRVPTVASNVGAFSQKIMNNLTGILCDTKEEWKNALEKLILNSEYRKLIGLNAYNYVIKKCTTIYTAYNLFKIIKQEMQKNIFFVLPNLQISGGITVALKHAEILQEFGYDVTILHYGKENNKWIKKHKKAIPVLNANSVSILGSIDKAVATLWSTTHFLNFYPNIKEHYYLVQGFETDFCKAGEFTRFSINQSYYPCIQMNFITVSKWCQKWLYEDYGHTAKFAPNGINISNFNSHKRQLKKKIRILIEGNCDDFYKNIDESFHITNQLPREKFEVWYMAGRRNSKKWYRNTLVWKAM